MCFFDGFSQGAQKRETGSIRSEEISWVDMKGSRLDPRIPGISVFHLKFTCFSLSE